MRKTLGKKIAKTLAFLGCLLFLAGIYFFKAKRGPINVIFAIVAAVKANKGELWVYPLSFQFIKR